MAGLNMKSLTLVKVHNPIFFIHLNVVYWFYRLQENYWMVRHLDCRRGTFSTVLRHSLHLIPSLNHCCKTTSEMATSVTLALKKQLKRLEKPKKCSSRHLWSPDWDSGLKSHWNKIVLKFLFLLASFPILVHQVHWAFDYCKQCFMVELYINFISRLHFCCYPIEIDSFILKTQLKHPNCPFHLENTLRIF